MPGIHGFRMTKRRPASRRALTAPPAPPIAPPSGAVLLLEGRANAGKRLGSLPSATPQVAAPDEQIRKHVEGASIPAVGPAEDGIAARSAVGPLDIWLNQTTAADESPAAPPRKDPIEGEQNTDREASDAFLAVPQPPNEGRARPTEPKPPTLADPRTRALAVPDFTLMDSSDDEAGFEDSSLLPFTRQLLEQTERARQIHGRQALPRANAGDATRWTGVERWDPLPVGVPNFRPDSPWHPPQPGWHSGPAAMRPVR